ncbi:MAG TPA: hypothetical protein DD381_02375 [Lentisphaeria bacterium]|nr:MAG: hypothetical protein A2X47_08660 [Lentisphaerae bacterium GWF2_38_69]HBM15182.1 hypothetical protein [Lentisphaeria bacterium]
MKINNDFLKIFYLAYLKAWNIFFETPFPVTANKLGKKIDYNNNDHDDLVLFAIPFVGLTVGFIAFVVITIGYLILGPIASAIICSLIVVSIWEILTQGKNSQALISNLTARWENFSASKMKRASSDTESNYVFIYIFITFLVIRILSLGFLIYYHHFGWIVITAVLVMAVQGHLASIGQNYSKEIYIFAGKKEQITMWIISGIICIIFSGFHLFPTIIAFVVVAFLGITTKQYLDKNDILNGEIIGIVGKYTEIFVLLIGLVYITYLR